MQNFKKLVHSASLCLSVTQASSSVKAFELQKYNPNCGSPLKSCWDKETLGFACMSNRLSLELTLCLWIVCFALYFLSCSKVAQLVINKIQFRFLTMGNGTSLKKTSCRRQCRDKSKDKSLEIRYDFFLCV